MTFFTLRPARGGRSTVRGNVGGAMCSSRVAKSAALLLSGCTGGCSPCAPYLSWTITLDVGVPPSAGCSVTLSANGHIARYTFAGTADSGGPTAGEASLAEAGCLESNEPAVVSCTALDGPAPTNCVHSDCSVSLLFNGDTAGAAGALSTFLGSDTCTATAVCGNTQISNSVMANTRLCGD